MTFNVQDRGCLVIYSFCEISCKLQPLPLGLWLAFGNADLNFMNLGQPSYFIDLNEKWY